MLVRHNVLPIRDNVYQLKKAHSSS